VASPSWPRARLVGARVLALVLAGQGCGSEDPPPEPSCGDVVSALLTACSEAFEDLMTCVDAVGVEACNGENLAHGRCLDEVWADFDEDLHDPSFSRYLCELAPSPADDCPERIAACEE